MKPDEARHGLPALGVLSLNVEGRGAAKLGRLTAMAWRRSPQLGEHELELVALFATKSVRVSVHVTEDHARRLGLAA